MVVLFAGKKIKTNDEKRLLSSSIDSAQQNCEWIDFNFSDGDAKLWITNKNHACKINRMPIQHKQIWLPVG